MSGSAKSSTAGPRSVWRSEWSATAPWSSSHGHGLADIASDTPVTEDTVFRIGSVTKTFTAIAVMQLWEQGLVDLDAPANAYLRAYRLLPAKAELPAGDRAPPVDAHRRDSRGARIPPACCGCETWARP